jgi:hypothetical protein
MLARVWSLCRPRHAGSSPALRILQPAEKHGRVHEYDYEECKRRPNNATTNCNQHK